MKIDLNEIIKPFEMKTQYIILSRFELIKYSKG